MPIRELFHLMAIVDDFDPAADFFDKLFSPHEVFGKSWSDFDKRWASINLVGTDIPFELMEPSKDPADAHFPLPKFESRFGPHLHSLSWLVDKDDFESLVRRMQAAGIRVVAPDSSPVGDEMPGVVFTHAKDTLGQLEFMAVGPEGWAIDARFNGNWGDKSPTWWRDEHPLGIVRLSHVTVGARDLERGLAVFEGALDGTVLHRAENEAYVLVGKETVVHLAVPTDDASALAQDMATTGAELPHQFTFLVRDLDAAERHATSVGAAIAERTADTIVLDPATTFGARVAFTTATIPGDPR
jgi:catechol 2,3-dioxygenase-like lactoylglutathione lyase family enzyme